MRNCIYDENEISNHPFGGWLLIFCENALNSAWVTYGMYSHYGQ